MALINSSSATTLILVRMPGQPQVFEHPPIPVLQFPGEASPGETSPHTQELEEDEIDEPPPPKKTTATGKKRRRSTTGPTPRRNEDQVRIVKYLVFLGIYMRSIYRIVRRANVASPPDNLDAGDQHRRRDHGAGTAN